MAFSPTSKNPGDLILSDEWNAALAEVGRLGSAKLDTMGGTVSGPLSVQSLNVGTLETPNRPLTVRGAAGTFLNVIANNGAQEVLLGADTNGGIVSTMTNHDLQLRTGNVTRLTVKADGKVGIGTATPRAGKLEIVNAATDQLNALQVNQLRPDRAAAVFQLNGVDAAWLTYKNLSVADTIWRLFKSGAPTIELNTNGNSFFNGGSVGIGTATPERLLEVAGGAVFRGAVLVGQVGPGRGGITIGGITEDFGLNIQGEPTLILDAVDRVWIKNGFRLFGPGGFDIAERFKTGEPVQTGQVVTFDEQAEAVKLCDSAYDRSVIGIASSEPAFVLGENEEEVPIALCGRVPCDVDADIAPVAVGDLLTTSPTPGHAQKVTEPERAVGATIGKALGALASGKGKILVLVSLQ